MPHCVIEYSQTQPPRFDPAVLVELAHRAMLDAGLFAPEAIKTRAIGYAEQRLGLEGYDFIHLQLRILDGRSLEQRRALAEHMVEALAAEAGARCSVTCEVIEMERASYAKRLT
ncbi:5-carboxymethyl-2-hydroxymuconate Delta-isomerase [Halotalea alkalilenta]|uniref:5-carboxymethyl-2-hydroxymuconate Delta-isomerase n=1 Tax=Halotalea alkalilenta TaxID=376489 RepID=UPI000481B027|nr:5-carboxymethyl-2-hydroxymuconate Delta-isomerase [Halotalea alkalilenta]